MSLLGRGYSPTRGANSLGPGERKYLDTTLRMVWMGGISVPRIKDAMGEPLEPVMLPGAALRFAAPSPWGIGERGYDVSKIQKAGVT